MKTSSLSRDVPSCIWCGGGLVKELSRGGGPAGDRWFHCADCARVFCAADSEGSSDEPRPAPRRPVLIRICKVPPSAFLEGVDLRPFNFRVAQTYEVPRHVAEVLIDWSYAEPVPAVRRT